MPMDKTVLATLLWKVFGPVIGPSGVPTPPTDSIKAYADGYIKMLKACTVSHLPGTVEASGGPGAPVAGKASGGKLIGVLGPVMAAVAGKGNPVVAASMLLEANAIATYLMKTAKVDFAQGTITGTSGESPSPAPGPLAAGAGKAGMITGIDGAGMAAQVFKATTATGPKQVTFYTELVNYTKKFALVEYKLNTVLGTMTGGKLTVGAAAGGKIA